jgi:hypothetical protein
MNPKLTASVIANELIQKAMKMETFEITMPVPDEFGFGGVVPFDLKIKDNTLTCYVHALTLPEARAQVQAWVKERTEGDW